MAKVYLFRKLSALSLLQRNVCSEAVSSVLEHVLQGRTSTIFNYGDWPGNGQNQVTSGREDVVRRIVEELFSIVYTLELTMEINISIRHVELSAADSIGQCMAKDHFVSAPKDVYAYIERVMAQLTQRESSEPKAHVLFIIHVSQVNVEQSVRLYGKLQLMHLMGVKEESTLVTPMGTLLRIIRALSQNPKTHMRYYNIRLTRLLEELLGQAETTVVFNYTEFPQLEGTVEVAAPSSNHEISADLWKELYREERNKYKCLKEQLLSLEVRSGSREQKQLTELLENLEQGSKSSRSTSSSSSGAAVELEPLLKNPNSLQPNYEICQRTELQCLAHEQFYREQHQMHQKLQQVKQEATQTIEELQDLQQLIEQLTIERAHHKQQLEQKDLKLDKLNERLLKALEELQSQKIGFQLKLSEFSITFSRLWQQQSKVLQMQEQQRVQQLSDMFDTMCKELGYTHQMQRQTENRLQISHHQLLDQVETESSPKL